MPRTLSWILHPRRSPRDTPAFGDVAQVMQEITVALTAPSEESSTREQQFTHLGRHLVRVLGDVAPGFLAAACLCAKRWQTHVIHGAGTPASPPQTDVPLQLFAAAEGPERNVAAVERHLPRDWHTWVGACGVERLRFFPEPFRARGVWFLAGEGYRHPQWAALLDFTARLLVTAVDSDRMGFAPVPDERDEVLEQEFARWLLAGELQLLCEMLGGRLGGEFGLDRLLLLFQSDVDDSLKTLLARGIEPAMAESVRTRTPSLRGTAELSDERLRITPRPEPAVATPGQGSHRAPYFPYSLVLRARTGARLVGVLGDHHERRLSPPDEQRLRRWLRQFELALDHQQRITQLEALSYTDALTGIFNRRFFKRRLAEEILRARRFGRSLSLVVFDVDRFKELNDTFGHQVGDQVLREITGLIAATARSIDILCRYGGDEFVIIMPDTSQTDCFSFTGRLQHAILDHAFRPGRGDDRVQFSISLGAAVFPLHAGEPERLFWCADIAMLRAKEAGRNQALVYEPGMDDSSRPSRR